MKCQASDDPGSYFSWVGEASRVVSSTPMWRFGVQCRGSVRDLIDLQRPHERTNEVMARSLADGSRSSSPPYRGCISPGGGDRKKNSGS